MIHSAIFRRTGAFVALLVASVQMALPSGKPLSQFLIDRWPPSDAIQAGSVTSLVQTRDGYLWIGSLEGLWRYDGVRFVRFDRLNFPALLSTRIHALFEDHQGNLWIGTEGGGLSEYSHAKMRTLTSRNGLPSDYVRAICEDPEGGIWVGTDGEGVCRITPDTIVSYGRENSGIDERVTSLVADPGGLWVGTYNGLYRFARGRWLKFDHTSGLTSDSIISLHGGGGDLWIGTFGGGVTLLREGRFSALTGRGGIPGRVVTGIMGDTATGIWFSTLKGGVSRLLHGEVSTCYLGGRGRGAYPLCLLGDREGNVWVGLQNEGFVRLRDAPFSFLSTSENSVLNSARTVIEDRKGRIWVGTANGLRFMTARGTFDSLHLGHQPRNLTALAEGRDGTIWIGTLDRGLYRLKGGGFHRVPLPGIATVWALYGDRSGVVWAGTTRGLVCFRGDSMKVLTYDNSGLSHNDVRAIAEGKDGNLWVGTSYGLDVLKGGRFTAFHKNSSGLSNDVVVALHVDARGDLWIGTLGGLNRLREGKFVSFSAANGLPDDAVGLILEDDEGYLWIASDRGLYRIRKGELCDYSDSLTHELRPVLFTRADGLLDPSVTGTMQPTAWKSRDGRVWFTATAGVAVADPSQLGAPQKPPPPVIEGMAVEGRATVLDSIPPLSPSVYEFEISYTAPLFVKGDQVKFRYRLEGLTEEWVNAGSRRTAFFTHTPPGRYLFRVMAAGSDGLWSGPGTTLPIRILPPFWMTWSFGSVAAFILLLTLYGLYRRRRSLRRREAERQLHLTRQLLEGQEAERKRIAAELHDGLGQNLMIIKNLALLGKRSDDDPRQMSDHLGDIARTATSTLDDVRRIAYNLRPVNLERFGLTESLKYMLDSMGGSSSIELRAEIDDIDGLLGREEEIHFFRIIQEAMSNVLKHSSSPTAVVRIRRADGGLESSVEDHGKGFDPATQVAGLGLSDITERVSILGGSFSVQSHPEMGTRLEIAIPNGKRS